MKIDLNKFEEDNEPTFIKTKKFNKPSTFTKVDRKRLKVSNRKPKHNK